ncbi:hypothetical protein BKA70DRAFT_1436090 [Coprinopsis sp. MPI-PUGE-AT-0042]|nr:hypothetical protein BKA70DRAFT_1436090 [Coprinopsis sp. MPI-PUGE-AT-0042]
MSFSSPVSRPSSASNATEYCSVLFLPLGTIPDIDSYAWSRTRSLAQSYSSWSPSLTSSPLTRTVDHTFLLPDADEGVRSPPGTLTSSAIQSTIELRLEPTKPFLFDDTFKSGGASSSMMVIGEPSYDSTILRPSPSVLLLALDYHSFNQMDLRHGLFSPPVPPPTAPLVSMLDAVTPHSLSKFSPIPTSALRANPWPCRARSCRPSTQLIRLRLEEPAWGPLEVEADREIPQLNLSTGPTILTTLVVERSLIPLRSPSASSVPSMTTPHGKGDTQRSSLLDERYDGTRSLEIQELADNIRAPHDELRGLSDYLNRTPVLQKGGDADLSSQSLDFLDAHIDPLRQEITHLPSPTFPHRTHVFLISRPISSQAQRPSSNNSLRPRTYSRPLSSHASAFTTLLLPPLAKEPGKTLTDDCKRLPSSKIAHESDVLVSLFPSSSARPPRERQPSTHLLLLAASTASWGGDIYDD